MNRRGDINDRKVNMRLSSCAEIFIKGREIVVGLGCVIVQKQYGV